MVDPDGFKFCVDAQIIKGGDNKHKMVVDGIASTADTDRDNENLYPIGFDFSPFLEYGLINYHHQTNKMPLAVIGEPIEAKIKKGQFYIKGFLYPSNPVAVGAFQQMQVFQNDSTKRRMGWSIEGKPLFVDPSNPSAILKALITNVALTPLPKNGKSYAQIVKGFSDEVEIPESSKKSKKIVQAVNGGKVYAVDITLANGGHIKITDDNKCFIDLKNKAIDTTVGRALIVESLEDKKTGHIRSKEHLIKSILDHKKFTTFKEFEETYYQVLDKLQEK